MEYKIEEDFEMFDLNWQKRLEYLAEIILNKQFYDYKKHNVPNLNYKLKISSNTMEDDIAIKDTLHMLKRLIDNVVLE